MLDIRPPSLCGCRMPRRWHSDFWLCSVRREVATMRYRITSSASVQSRAAEFRQSPAQIVTYLESCLCTSATATSVESYSCKKSRWAPPPNRATLLLLAANLSTIGFMARPFAAGLESKFGGFLTREPRSQSPLECALTQKWGWGVHPTGGFLR